VVHRLLKQQLARGDRALADDERAPLEERLDEAAATASERERTTLDAERQIADLYRALYMRSHLGGIFQGTVVAIVTSGVFVRLDDPFVDVMVPNDALGPGGHEMDESGLAVVGLYSGERIELGSDMSVEVEEASLVRRVVLAKRVQRSERRLSKKERRQVRRRSAAQARKGHGGGKRGGGKRGGGRSGGGKRSGGKRGGGKRGGGGRRR
jgi:ribonuclease R